MSDNLERYQCQMALPRFGESAQELLQKARVLIVGAGGLGCPAAQYLTAAGIGTVGIADDDTVSLSNLHRQILYTPQDVGLSKVEVAAQKLRQQNPAVNIVPYPLRVTVANVMTLIEDFDLVIEGTDNFETKYLLNDACVLSGKPLVYGAIYQYEGQVATWNVRQEDGSYSPNYRDAFPDGENAQVPNCAQGGVIPTVAGIVGCMQANEAIKYITGKEELLAGKLWMVDVSSGRTTIIRLKKNASLKITGLPAAVEAITFAELQQGDYELIDVRSEAERAMFNIGGRHIPLEELKNSLDTLSFGGTVVCYCASGPRSILAARLIRDRFPQVAIYYLKNGTAGIKDGFVPDSRH